MQYVHGLEIQSAHTTHECLLEVLLHQRPISLFILNKGVSIGELVSQRLDLLVVLCADVLKLKLHSLFEIFTVLLHLPLPILSFPAEENGSLNILSILSESILQDMFGVLFEVSVTLQSGEGTMLQNFDPQKHLALARPE